MGKQVGEVKLEGTIGNVTFYKMEGEYYARLKSSLSGKRVKKDPCFRRTMEYAGWLKQASGLASCCYKALPEEERVHAMYREMVGMAMQMLKAGKDAEVISVCLDMMFRKEDVVPVVKVEAQEVMLEEVMAQEAMVKQVIITEMMVKEVMVEQVIITEVIVKEVMAQEVAPVMEAVEQVAPLIPMAPAIEASRLYVDNTGRLTPDSFGNNLITLPPCYFQLILPEIPDTHEKIRGIHPVFFHTYTRRRKFFHGAEYH